MEEIIKKYFNSWIEKDISVIKNIFAQNVIYSECYGAEYCGIDQVIIWFTDWNKSGNVLKWTIKKCICINNILVAEWHFKCDYRNEISTFNGVTIAEFNEDGKIFSLREYESKSEHFYPYGKI